MSPIDAYVDISGLPPHRALPQSILFAAVKHLPSGWVRRHQSRWQIAETLASSYLRVVQSDFTRIHWSLLSPRDVTDTVHWCMLGGSFLADFAMDPTKPRIFAWGLNPLKEPSFFALNELKGRDANRIPTAACAPVGRIVRFIDRERLVFDEQILLDFLYMAPAGIRVPANRRVPEHYTSEDRLVQFILAGADSPYMRLVAQFLAKTGFELMGITSGNRSGKGKFAIQNQGTHKNLDEIQQDMGSLGIPILAGDVQLPDPSETEALPIHAKYHKLHDPYKCMPREEFSKSTELLPLSVTICQPVNDRTYAVR